ncbi:MAG: ATP synthase F0 subunit B [Nitrospirae bacterium GWC2_46_6]|nr:MAG: ATP synthase F0 subunit B [Nitrospirae bacterium GWA2_46_11]OGW21464.1 MAG: ATP synthase F0 subunit B [Nitrospirae bacterium GWC2_46_6]OGW23949.1 MAG: ATP synthase F0 subunit B [Nitrospirae bacterium GWB2_47_37]HAK89321.1 ATP synthase F0 subunit B [Nitrospiraceae bacterium]HCL81634.1 ATP synthase F0 subunit B [Nitrospiraceae bacterium]
MKSISNLKFQIPDFKKIISIGAAVCILLLVFQSSSAFAAEGSEHGSSLMDWVWRIVNFAILVFVLVKFLNKPLRSFLQQRKELIEKSIKEAQEAKALALKALAEVEERLKVKDKEIEEIISSAKTSGEREKERLIAEGEKLKVKILEQAKANIDFEVKRAKDTIKAEAVEAAMQLAEEKIKSKLTKEDQERLMQESIKLLRGN